MNDDLSSGDGASPSVQSEIPSAVRSGTTRNTLALLAVAALAVAVLFLLKGGHGRTAANPADSVLSGGTEPPVASPTTLPLQAFTLNPPTEPLRDPRTSLRDMRRTSPILIFNNTSSNPAAEGTPGAAEAPGLPMPAGFHPTTASRSQSSNLGDREFIVAQGKLIDAVLETAINTDHPGMLRALVSDDIYGDSGRTVLLPRGSRLIGQYDSGVSQGQSRVFVIWQRAIRPDGIDITLDSGGTDALGQAGLDGNVHRHFFTMFGAATLLSVIGAAAATVGVQPQDTGNSLATYRSSVAQGFTEAANSVMGVFVRIKPTITVRQGMAIKVFVARDLYFDPSLIRGRQVQVIP